MRISIRPETIGALAPARSLLTTASPGITVFLVITVFLGINVLFGTGCEEDKGPAEVVSRPDTPQGEIDRNPGEEGTYWTAGSVSTQDHRIEYRYDLDASAAHRYTAWSAAETVMVSWPDTARYVVRAQARCTDHNDIISEWSPGLTVGVGVEIISTPVVLVAEPAAWPALPYSFCTPGATSNKMHPVEYQFEFSDGATTPWDSMTTCVFHTWTLTGDQTVSARARCRIHTDAVSADGTIGVPLPPPGIRFATHIDGVSKPYPPGGLPVPADTVGMFAPFSISYHGISPNAPIAAYEFARGAFSGPPVWNTDTGDTMRDFSNAGAEVFPSGVARFVTRCLDQANAQSQIATAEVVVNFDPDTKLQRVLNNYSVGGVVQTREIDFTDAEPDTVPYGSWLFIQYSGTDDPRDLLRCDPPAINPDRCIDFQIAYRRESERILGTVAHSGWLPRSDGHDTDPNSTIDSNSVNMGSLEYDLFVRSVDENGRPDGTRPEFHIVGNFDPTLDSLLAIDHFGNDVVLDGGGPVDTLRWNFFKGTSAGIDPLGGQPRSGWPYQAATDTIDFGDTELPYIKRYKFRIRARGHDHPMETNGSGVKSWEYFIYTDYGLPTEQFWPLARAGNWANSVSINVLDDEVEVTFRYPGLAHPTLPPDPNGDTVFANLPGYFNEDLTLVMRGRDTAVDEPVFSQYVYLNGVRTLINQYPAASLGRWTEERIATFHLEFER